MPQQLDLSTFVRPAGDGQSAITLAVEGVRCGGCIARIEAAMRRLPSVVEARLNFSNRRLTIVWTKGANSPAEFLGALEALGYRAHPFQARAAEEEERQYEKWLLRCLAVAGFAGMNIMLLSVSVWSGNASDITPETRDLFHWASALIALPASAYAGLPFFLSAIAALKARSVNMDVPISLGVFLALGMSVVETVNSATHAYFDSAVMLLFFLLCGRYLDAALRRRTRAVAGNLAALKAETAQRIAPDEQIVVVPASVLMAGDRVLLRPGDRVPADGVILSGQSEIDDSLVTGESLLRTVGENATVYAGSVNVSGALTLRVTAAGEATLIDEIERLMDQAVKAKSRIVHLADRAARAYAPIVHTAAAVTFIGWLAFGASLHTATIVAITVLIITCPCALALAIPAVQVVAAGRLFRGGVFLHGGDAIERLADADTVVFDKTGTLTLPAPQVSNADVVPADTLERAARLALASHHPLAQAVARHAHEKLAFANVQEEPGQGIRATIDGVEARLGSPAFCGVAAANDMHRDGAAVSDSFEPHAPLIPARAGIRQPLASPSLGLRVRRDERDGELPNLLADKSDASFIAFRRGDETALFIIRQSLRPDARATVDALRAMGLGIAILSGDRADAVAPVARALGIDEWHAGMKPADKVKALDALKAQGRRVLMVGDGLNDAPSLAAAYVSMSPITAADLSQAQADAVFLGERLAPVREATETARNARALMRQNLWLAGLYNLFAVPIAMAGLVTPLIAALAMSGSSLLVTLNALRLHRAAARRQIVAAAPRSSDSAAPPAAHSTVSSDGVPAAEGGRA
jgi:P-type Cu2+ transporter